MAQVAHVATFTERIDRTLARAQEDWANVPSLVAEWPNWDDHSRFSFIIDWPICEDRLQQLVHWSGQGMLSPDQQARYAALLCLVEQYRPMLTRLFEE